MLQAITPVAILGEGVKRPLEDELARTVCLERRARDKSVNGERDTQSYNPDSNPKRPTGNDRERRGCA